MGRAALVAIYAWWNVLSVAASASGNTGYDDYSIERFGLVVLQLRDTVWGAVVFDSPLMGSRFLEGLEDDEVCATF
jgi:hypothetical protein